MSGDCGASHRGTAVNGAFTHTADVRHRYGRRHEQRDQRRPTRLKVGSDPLQGPASRRVIDDEVERCSGKEDRTESPADVHVLDRRLMQHNVEVECRGALTTTVEHVRRRIETLDIEATTPEFEYRIGRCSPLAATTATSPFAKYVLAMSTFQHDGLDLYYERHGSPAGVPVVLLHGLSSCGGSYVELLDALGDRVDAYTLDFRGHGQSARASGTYVGANYSADVRAFVTEVVGRPAFMAGHSLGGAHTFSIAQSSPELVRGALCEDPPLYFCFQEHFEASPYSKLFPRVRDAMRAFKATDPSREQVRSDIAAQPSPSGGCMADHSTDAVMEWRVDAFFGCDPDVWDPAITGGSLDGYDPDRPVAVPLTVLRADPACYPAFSPEDAARLQAVMPSAQIHLVPGSPHFILAHRTTTAEYVNRFTEFLGL